MVSRGFQIIIMSAILLGGILLYSQFSPIITGWVIQDTFEDNVGLMLFIFFLAFILKISVATSITVWLKSGNFEEYFLNVPKAYEKALKNLNDK